MRQLLFITIMGSILSPLAVFQSDDPFRNMGRMPAELEGFQAVQILAEQGRRIYSRAETVVTQSISELADDYLGR